MLEIAVPCAFAGAVALVVRPLAAKLGKRRFIIDFAWAPLLAVAVLLLLGQADPAAVLAGITGNGTIKPLTIIVLFFSLAYVCISIDMTGLFKFVALHAASGAGTSARKLFMTFFGLSAVFTVFTSNDIVILTLTPIILYFCKYTGMKPWPFLAAQFLAANIFSTTLYIGNPTNIIVAQAYGIGFVEYSAWMVLPTLAAGGTCLLLAWRVLGKDLPPAFTPPPGMDPREALTDKPGAIIGSCALASCLALLVVAPVFHWDMGLICLAFAVGLLVKDALHDRLDRRRARGEIPGGSRLRRGVTRVPWKIMPFVLGMFVLVELLDRAGWVAVLGSGLGTVQASLGVAGATFFTCIVSALACNVMNNQPMTILFTKMLQGAAMLPPAVARASMLALVLGSNFGANFTLVGALAGIMWASITRTQGVTIEPRRFARLGFTVMPLVIAAACTVLAIELLVAG